MPIDFVVAYEKQQTAFCTIDSMIEAQKIPLILSENIGNAKRYGGSLNEKN